MGNSPTMFDVLPKVPYKALIFDGTDESAKEAEEYLRQNTCFRVIKNNLNETLVIAFDEDHSEELNYLSRDTRVLVVFGYSSIFCYTKWEFQRNFEVK